MNSRSFPFAAFAMACGLALSSGSASATWTFSASATKDANGDYLANTSITANPTSDPSLSISGVYAANGASNTGFASGASWLTSASTAAAKPTYYSGNGLGMSSDGAQVPNHALDNAGTNTEGIMLSFSSSVVLSSIGLGYVCQGTNCGNSGTNGDTGGADLSVFRYKGTFAPPSLTGVGADKTSMTNAGWELVGNYGDLGVDTTASYSPVNGSGLGSSWWLITAYNSSYGSATSGSVDQGNDYFKLFAVAASVCTGSTAQCGGSPSNAGVPEPGSLALAGLALLGVYASRRKPQVARLVAA